MTRETIERIMKDNLIASNKEANSALNFVRDLIYAEIEYLEINEPNATRSINKLKEANSSIIDLLDEL